MNPGKVKGAITMGGREGKVSMGTGDCFRSIQLFCRYCNGGYKTLCTCQKPINLYNAKHKLQHRQILKNHLGGQGNPRKADMTQ